MTSLPDLSTPVSLPQVSAAPAPGDLTISVRDVGKMYRIYDRPQDRLKQMLWRGRRSYGREFWALRDTSFEVRRGEWMGIVGRNGSGKSTLLQMIAGTLAPTEGEIQVRGRVAALLELGSGFNPEFTGRENVYMNGAILGMTPVQIDERYEQIAAFADIGSFINQPVKLYSSGMFLRLAFAVSTSMEPDVLLIDEALAVGDVFFRQKCFQRLEYLAQRGVSILLVSHSMMDIEQFCQRAIVLDKGAMIYEGGAIEAVKHYMLIEQADRIPTSLLETQWDAELTAAQPELPALIWPEPSAFLDMNRVQQASNGWARCTGVALCNSQGIACRVFRQGEQASFFYEFELARDLEVPVTGTVIHNDKGVLVHGKSTIEYGTDVPQIMRSGSRLRVRQDITLDLAMGDYTFEPGLSTISRRDYERRGEYAWPQLEAKMVRMCHLPSASSFVVVAPQQHRPIQLIHHGIANLPGDCHVSLHAPAAQPGANGVEATKEAEA